MKKKPPVIERKRKNREKEEGGTLVEGGGGFKGLSGVTQTPGGGKFLMKRLNGSCTLVDV